MLLVVTSSWRFWCTPLPALELNTDQEAYLDRFSSGICFIIHIKIKDEKRNAVQSKLPSSCRLPGRGYPTRASHHWDSLPREK